MKRKRISRLALSRESLRTLDPDPLQKAAGGLASTSENCSANCTNTSGGPRSYCICPLCPSNPC